MSTLKRASGAPRRGFLGVATAGFGAIVGALAAVPGLTFLGHPLRAKTVRGSEEPIRVAGPEDIPAGRPLRVEIFGQRRDGWMRLDHMKLGAAWLVRTAEGRIRAFSTACPHLGCSIDWNDKTQKFDCPCHNSGFAVDGRCLFGPAPRGLDELEVDASDKDVRVRYQRFKPALKEKEPLG